MCIHEGLDNASPRTRQVAPVVAAAACTDDPALAVLVGESTQRRRRLCVRLFAPAKVRYGIALQAVRAALHDDELRLRRFEVALNPLPGFAEITVIGAGRQRNIQLRAASRSRTRLLGRAGSRVQEPAIFVDIGEDKIGIGLEAVKDAVAMMCVDINVGHSLEAELFAQVLDGNTTVIKNTESSGAAAGRVMQPGNRNERALVIAVHDFVDGAKHGADDGGCGVIDAGDDRSVAVIEPALACRRHARHLVNVLSRMEQRQFVYEGRTRVTKGNRIT